MAVVNDLSSQNWFRLVIRATCFAKSHRSWSFDQLVQTPVVVIDLRPSWLMVSSKEITMAFYGKKHTHLNDSRWKGEDQKHIFALIFAKILQHLSPKISRLQGFLMIFGRSEVIIFPSTPSFPKRRSNFQALGIRNRHWEW